jgi:hypothetical protein
MFNTCREMHESSVIEDGTHETSLGDLPLHDEKVRIVDVELNGLEELLDELLRRLVAVHEVLGEVRKSDLEVSCEYG